MRPAGDFSYVQLSNSRFPLYSILYLYSSFEYIKISVEPGNGLRHAERQTNEGGMYYGICNF